MVMDTADHQDMGGAEEDVVDVEEEELEEVA